MGAKDIQTAETIVQEKSLAQFVRESRLEWAGHVWRVENNIAKIILVNNINKKRPGGRLKQRWLDVVKRDNIELRPEWIGDLNHAYKRDEGNKLVLTAKGLDGL